MCLQFDVNNKQNISDQECDGRYLLRIPSICRLQTSIFICECIGSTVYEFSNFLIKHQITKKVRYSCGCVISLSIIIIWYF
jgi:hypothetical protein